MASIKKLTRTEWRVTCRGLPQHNTTFKSTSAANRYATALVAQGLTAQVTKAETACWVARVRRVGERDIAKTFDKNEDAKNWVSETEGKMVTGVYTDVRKAGRITLGELLLKFDSEKRADLPASDPERTRIRKMCEHVISKVRLSSLAPKHFADYREERLKVVKGTTVTRELAIFCSVINLAMKEDELALPFNPASGQRVSRPADQPGDTRDRRFKELHVASPRPLSPTLSRKPKAASKVVGTLTAKPGASTNDPSGAVDVNVSAPWVMDTRLIEWMQIPQTEEQLLLRACRYPHWFRPRKAAVSESTLRDREWRQRGHTPVKARSRLNGRFWALISFAVQTAMRRRELLELQWQHVHLQEGYVDLPGNITKNRKPRIVPLSLRAIRILQTQPQTSDFVFPFTMNTVKEAFKRARARADATDLRLHDLRHEATSRLFERTTLRVSEIGDITGHTDPRMLQRYYNKRTSEFVQRFKASFIR